MDPDERGCFWTGMDGMDGISSGRKGFGLRDRAISIILHPIHPGPSFFNRRWTRRNADVFWTGMDGMDGMDGMLLEEGPIQAGHPIYPGPDPSTCFIRVHRRPSAVGKEKGWLSILCGKVLQWPGHGRGASEEQDEEPGDEGEQREDDQESEEAVHRMAVRRSCRPGP